MAPYVVLSRFSPEAFRDPGDFKKLAGAVSSKIKSECPGIRWKESFAALGRFDTFNAVESDDSKQIERAAMIIRAYSIPARKLLPPHRGRNFFPRCRRVGWQASRIQRLSDSTT